MLSSLFHSNTRCWLVSHTQHADPLRPRSDCDEPCAWRTPCTSAAAQNVNLTGAFRLIAAYRVSGNSTPATRSKSYRHLT